MTTISAKDVGGVTPRFVVSNDEISLSLLPRGACLQWIQVDGVGVGHGYAETPDYLDDTCYSGVVVGRFANRIAGGRFFVDGVEHHIPVNDRGNALHGGPAGLSTRDWAGRVIDSGVEFTVVSPDGDMGFPGRLTAVARYLLDGRSVTVELRATSDAPTVVNLTQHTYFNLGGFGMGATILDHELRVLADHVVEVDPDGIPTGALSPVDGHRFDLRRPRRIAELDHGRIDHCLVLSPDRGETAAMLRDPASGRSLQIGTDAPGLQVYGGESIGHAGVALETQWLPDSPNHPHFPSTLLRPGHVWSSTTTWTFA